MSSTGASMSAADFIFLLPVAVPAGAAVTVLLVRQAVARARAPLLPGQRWTLPGLGPVTIETVTRDEYALFGGRPARDVTFTRPDSTKALTVTAEDFQRGRMLTASEYAVAVERGRIEAEADGLRVFEGGRR
jgi:hypothetical protein